MNRLKFEFACLVLLLVAVSYEPLRCGISTPSSYAGEIPPSMLITHGKTREGFAYLSGGVSSEEREIIDHLAKGYNVKLSFAEKGGAYLADVHVAIVGGKGDEIIAVTTDGPLFYIQLPPGDYRVSASFNGAVKEIRRLEVQKGKTVQQTLVWDLGKQSPEGT